MVEDEIVRYTGAELRRVAAMLAQPGMPASHAPPGPAPGPQAMVTGRRAGRDAGQIHRRSGTLSKVTYSSGTIRHQALGVERFVERVIG